MYFHALALSELYEAQAASTRPPSAPARSRKILVAFDGSPAAREALEHAVARARAERSELHVVNVQEVLVDNVAMYQAYRQHGERILAEAAEQLAPHGVRFTTQIAFGSPARSIVRAARDEGSDHIVVGTANRSGMAGLFTSSVSREVVRLAEVPVTVIKEETK